MDCLTPINYGFMKQKHSFDTGAVRTVMPMEVVHYLGLRIRGQQIAKYADGRQESVGLTTPVIIEIEGRETTEVTFGSHDEVY